MHPILRLLMNSIKFVILDGKIPNSFWLFQLDVASYLTSSAISPSGTYMAFGDADGVIHLLSQAEEQVPFNGFEGNPYPWADTPAPLPDIEWSDSTYVVMLLRGLVSSLLSQTTKLDWNALFRRTFIFFMAPLSIAKTPSLPTTANYTPNHSTKHEDKRQHCICCTAQGTQRSQKHGHYASNPSDNKPVQKRED